MKKLHKQQTYPSTQTQRSSSVPVVSAGMDLPKAEKVCLVVFGGENPPTLGSASDTDGGTNPAAATGGDGGRPAVDIAAATPAPPLNSTSDTVVRLRVGGSRSSSRPTPSSSPPPTSTEGSIWIGLSGASNTSRDRASRALLAMMGACVRVCVRARLMEPNRNKMSRHPTGAYLSTAASTADARRSVVAERARQAERSVGWSRQARYRRAKLRKSATVDDCKFCSSTTQRGGGIGFRSKGNDV